MNRPYAIHITGASGAGVTTLGRALADATGAMPLDTDDFYWVPEEPAYGRKRPVEDRLRLIQEAILAAGSRGWILSGSIGAWGAPLVPRFDRVIFLHTPTPVRLARLHAREVMRFGEAALAPDGERSKQYAEFLDWSADYDTGNRPGRSLARHEAFLAQLTCPVLRLDGSEPIGVLVEKSLRT